MWIQKDMAKVVFQMELMSLLLCGSIIPELQKDYHSRYEDWKNMYKSQTTSASGYLQIAKRKSGGFQQYTRTEKDAVEIVNLYTQDSPKIYFTVNSQYRQNSVERIWEVYAGLLNEAIDILLKYNPCSKCNELYRGSKVLPQGIPGTSLFKGFTSTTTNPGTAVKFGIRNDCYGCQVLLILNGANGLDVKRYSQYASEDEVLLKLNSKFSFPSDAVFYRKYPSNRTKLDKELRRLKLSGVPVNILARGIISDGNILVSSYLTVISCLVIPIYANC